MSYNFLPGTIVNTLDGGLAAPRQPKAKSTIIFGTSDKGQADQPTQVIDPAKAALQFGFSGTLIRGMEEVRAQGCDNIILFRMGTKPMVLKGVGATDTLPGVDVTFNERTADAATRYKVWYNAGVLAVYLDGELVFSNDPAAPVDNGIDVTLSVFSTAGFAGLELGTGVSASLVNAITVQAAAALVGATATPAPTVTAPVTGIGLTGRQLYVALAKAIDLCDGLQVEQVLCPGTTLDAPNVAFYVAADSTTAVNNPATNPDALNWLKTTVDVVGNKTYQWASDLLDSEGNVTTAMAAATPADRLAAGFHEVNFGYLLANFAAKVSILSNTCQALIGTSAPKSFKLVDVRNWIGALPTYDANGTPVSAGRGLLGIAALTGTTVSKLNPLCTDFAQGHRLPGFFQNASEAYDGGADSDANGNPIDIGAYLHVVADLGVHSNGWGANYAQNIATSVAGLNSVLDAKVSLMNRSLTVRQIPGLTYIPGQLDALTAAKIIVLRNKGLNASPALLHDLTAATDASDYTNGVRMRIKGLVIKTMLARADKYLGQATLDGLQLQSMKTELDEDLVQLQTRGYISKPSVVISTDDAQSRIGHATLNLTFSPADELIQLTANVGLSR